MQTCVREAADMIVSSLRAVHVRDQGAKGLYRYHLYRVELVKLMQAFRHYPRAGLLLCLLGADAPSNCQRSSLRQNSL